MSLNRNKLYLLLFTACLAGYVWLFFSNTRIISRNESVELCLVKRATNIPCPSCGSTRSVISLTKGNFSEAFYLNPLGYIVAFIMIFAPPWIVIDIITKRNSLFFFYQKVESILKEPKFAIPLAFLVIVNWIWNIIKHL